MTAARQRNWTRLVEYASTGEGSRQLHDQFAVATLADPSYKMLAKAIDEGAVLAQANRRVEDAWRAENGKPPLKTPLPLTLAQSAALAEEERLAAEEAARVASDPLGLRAADSAATDTATTPATLPTRPTMLPTAPPQIVLDRAAQQETAQRAATARAAAEAAETQDRVAIARAQVAAQERLAAQAARQAAQTERDQARFQAQAARDQARAQAQAQAQAQRDQARAQAQFQRAVKVEERRLGKETDAEVKLTRQWFSETALRAPTVQNYPWRGPTRWTDPEARMSRRQARDLRAEGRRDYGDMYENAVRKYRGVYTPAEITQAAATLERQASAQLRGQVRHPGWYAGYEAHNDDSIDQARAHAFSQAFGPSEVNRMARAYASINLETMLAGTLKTRPVRPGWKSLMDRATVFWVQRRPA